MIGVTSIRELNLRAREFWEEQRILMDKRMADEAVLEFAVLTINSRAEKLRPIGWQKSFEEALEEAEAARKVFNKHLGRRGGRAEKQDALQKLIVEIVERNPEITQRELLAKLDDRKGLGPIQDIEGAVIYITRDDGTTKEAAISGLKDRLFRAKKKIRSR